MPEFPEIPEVQRLTPESEDRYGKTIAVATVVTTLAAALVAFMQASALRIDDEAAVRAERLAAQSLGERVRSQQSAQLQFERFELAEQQRRRAANARQARFFGAGARERELRLAEERWLAVADQTDKTSAEIAKSERIGTITERGPDGPARDNTFPDRFFARSREEAYRLTALRDAANEEGDRAEQQFTAYAVSLTMFAVAVFLFGYSLTPQGRPRRRLFSGVATAFLSIAAIWALLTALDPPNRPPDEAAEAFAKGRVALEVSDYDGAIPQLSRAIGLRPTFAQAYILRAQARTLQGSPQQLALAPSVTSDRALADAVADERMALDLGSKDPDLLLGLGFDLFRLGLKRDDEDLLDESVELSKEAREGFKSSPIPDYNRGVALLAAGKVEEAREAYGDAIERTVFADVGKKEKRNDIVAEEGFVAGALTDLEIVQKAKGKELGAEIRETKRRIVSALSAVALPPSLGDAVAPDQARRAKGPKPVLRDIELDVTPAYAQFRVGSEENIDPTKDRISVQWYHLEKGGLGWTVLPQISGPATEDELKVNLENKYFLRRSYLQLTRPFSCLPEGRYRVEVYVNGILAGQGSTDTEFGDLVAAPARDLNVGFCRPAGWRASRKGLTGLVSGFTSGDGREGAYIISINNRVAGAGPQEPSERLSGQILDDAVRRFEYLLPRPVGASQASDAPFAGLEGELVRVYDYPGGTLIAGAGASKDGEQLVGFTFGPPEFHETGQADFSPADRVFFSFSEL